jgi:ABC-type oligopeptide transport system ATPase subunit
MRRTTTKRVLQHPRHDYTRQLLAPVPNPFAAAAATSTSTDNSVAEGRTT